jgi:hypothetical protein
MTKGGVQTERSETEESETLNLQGSAMFSSNVFFGPDCLRMMGEHEDVPVYGGVQESTPIAMEK